MILAAQCKIPIFGKLFCLHQAFNLGGDAPLLTPD
jgi:hypothetical protein